MNELNEIILKTEKGMINGEFHSSNPHECLDRYVILTGYLSTCYGYSEKLEIQQAKFFVNNRPNCQSDLACTKQWKVSLEGQKQAFWDMRAKRIKTLQDALLVIYYKGRNEAQQKEV